MKKNLPKIIFFQIKKQSDKLANITKTASMHFENRKPILFLVGDDNSQTFLDELLWKEPRFSFLPHTIAEIPIEENIVISQKRVILNNAQYIFNLTSDPISDLECNVIYEFDDYTDKERALISRKKFKFYKENGFLIEAC
jgi:DNA polymerase IIIc chi subunit